MYHVEMPQPYAQSTKEEVEDKFYILEWDQEV